MNIFVAISTLFVRDWLHEIGVLVTHEAAGFGMLSVQRKLGHIVVESGFGAYGFPTGSHVACLARALRRSVHESTTVGICVAVLTTGKTQSLVPGRSTAR